jgi:glycosyltransferase involved in cell wall biosynthesis
MPAASKPLLIVFANSLWNLANFRAPLIEALRAEGYQVEVAGPDEALSHPQADVLGTPAVLPIHSDAVNPLRDGWLLVAIARLLRRRRPAALLSFTPKPNIYGAMAARVAGIPAIPNVSGLGTAFLGRGPLRRLVMTLYRSAFRGVPTVFFQNPDDRDLFVTHGLVRAEQARLLPGSGVDCARFAPVERTDDGRAGPHFLFVGRLLAQKGLRELIAAIRLVKRRHPQARFSLLGFVGAANRSAIGRQELDSWIEEGLIEYLGSVDDVRPHLAAADAVILPSWREGLPRSLLEAAAMGKPLIASDVPGCREIVRDGINGFLHEVRSADSIAMAIDRFIALTPAEQAAMGAASRQRAVADFAEQRVIDAYIAAVRRVVPLPLAIHRH